jgi:hypothetical protein
MTTCATPGTAQETKTGGNKAGGAAAAIKALFKNAVKAVTRRDEDEPLPKSRRSGETEKGFVMAVRRRQDFDPLRKTHRAVARGGTSKAFGAAAKEALLDDVLILDDAAGGGFGANLFDPASAYWQGNNAHNEQWQNEDFGAKQDNYFPQP